MSKTHTIRRSLKDTRMTKCKQLKIKLRVRLTAMIKTIYANKYDDSNLKAPDLG